MNMPTILKTSVLLAALLTINSVAYADRDHGFERGRPGWVMDGRYNHNHYYPPAGYIARGLPRGYVSVRYHDSPFFFSQGVWYRPHRYGFAVVAAPIGAFLPVLPPFYSTVRFGGVPYYYADNVYYVRDADRDGYVVTTPPTDANASVPSSGEDIFTYPKNGQSEQQQATDRYDCHRWAADQTGYDVTQQQGGVNANQVESKRNDYHRAEVACLEGRGYSVK